MPEGKKPRRFGTVERYLQKGVTNLHVGIFRATRGRVLGHMIGMPVLLLNTTGRKTGKKRTTVLTYNTDGEDILLVASNGGVPRHPVWYLNLEADPDVEIEMGPRTERRRARTATEEEKERLWPGIVETYGGYGRYQDRAQRDIPVVILEKKEAKQEAS
jgi:deazaflavin-dependent oxidoreductase (nitroreductase family)